MVFTVKSSLDTSTYVNRAYKHAVYNTLQDGTFAGIIPSCPGVITFASTLRKCEAELKSTLEDWILVGLRLGNPLPVIDSIDPNKQPGREQIHQPQTIPLVIPAPYHGTG